MMSNGIFPLIDKKFILVTGGAGFIGSQTILQLCLKEYNIVVIDNLCNSSEDSIKRIEMITGKKIYFYKLNILNEIKLNKIFENYNIWAVIHFAGLKSVSESWKYPEKYYNNNVEGTRVLVQCMIRHNVNNIIFSSSATVYGNPIDIELLTEESKINPLNPYGISKLKAENVIINYFKDFTNGQACILRYFNPIGADISGLIGENPIDIPNNLLPYICQVLIGKRKFLNIYGNDYPTHDGTGVRDYIHVIDLANGHIAALEKLRKNEYNHDKLKKRIFIYNMGTGKGYSVLEIIKTMSDISGKIIPYKFTNRRKGDAAQVIASPKKANDELQWQAKYDITSMCYDAWKWQLLNPNGYKNPSLDIIRKLNNYQKK